MIVMHEPVWNGGDPYFSIRTDRVEKDTFIRCDYTKRDKSLAYPNPFWIDGKIVKQGAVFSESWGKAYRVHLSELERLTFWFTIAWEGEEEGEFSYSSPSFQDTCEAVKEYLAEYKEREAFLRCASAESITFSHNITEKVKDFLTKQESK